MYLGFTESYSILVWSYAVGGGGTVLPRGNPPVRYSDHLPNSRALGMGIEPRL